jgi:uncharacterized protein (TIGR02246 family)
MHGTLTNSELRREDSKEGLGFRTAEEFLRFVRNRWEEALPRANMCLTESSEAAHAADAVVLALVHAWNEHDMQAWGACFTEDADYVDGSGAHWRGKWEIEAKHVEMHRSTFAKSRLHPLEWTIRLVSSEVALVHLQWRLQGVAAAPGYRSSQTRCGVLTLTIVSRGDRWLVTSAHNAEVAPVLHTH